MSTPSGINLPSDASAPAAEPKHPRVLYKMTLHLLRAACRAAHHSQGQAFLLRVLPSHLEQVVETDPFVPGIVYKVRFQMTDAEFAQYEGLLGEFMGIQEVDAKVGGEMQAVWESLEKPSEQVDLDKVIRFLLSGVLEDSGMILALYLSGYVFYETLLTHLSII
ncbi:hypothetical protein GQ43DRAFT_500596 [Delitschia confertaspora ATCC 74209]|uniref:Uncharacterized protein n=1 Tax=Delitschia confertaspora ATCC 74209 TaxID=1513339 RepID=A0A9P4MTX7_9PLEO|nr:hypothetical protein GQ43DRAFT_500596 [Delitschia confertaspora ATCC 74209]